jgi:hypothetical protein
MIINPWSENYRGKHRPQVAKRVRWSIRLVAQQTIKRVIALWLNQSQVRMSAQREWSVLCICAREEDWNELLVLPVGFIDLLRNYRALPLRATTDTLRCQPAEPFGVILRDYTEYKPGTFDFVNHPGIPSLGRERNESINPSIQAVISELLGKL